jgi:hypothetical protein
MIAAMTAFSPGPRQEDLDLRAPYGPFRASSGGMASTAATAGGTRPRRATADGSLTVVTGVTPPCQREMPVYPACCRCGQKRDDPAAFYADPPTQSRRFAGLL